jgi:phospholipase C
LFAKNAGTVAASLNVLNVYTGVTTTYKLNSGAMFETSVSLAEHAGWYDFVLTVESDVTFHQEIAGHLETGKPSTTDPAIG